MKNPLNGSPLPLAVALALAALTAPAAAQTVVARPAPAAVPSPTARPAAAPSPVETTPAPSPAVLPEPVVRAEKRAKDEKNEAGEFDAPRADDEDDVDFDMDVDADTDVDIDLDEHVIDENAIQESVQEAMAHARAEVERSVEQSLKGLDRRGLSARQQALAERTAALAGRRGMTAEAREAMAEALAEADAARLEAAEAAQEKTQEAQEKAREKAEEAREKARAKAEADRERSRERAEEARERAREAAQEARERAREQAQEAAERVDELYDAAMESIDDEEWSDALRPLNRLMSLNARVDAALYWTAYAQAKLNQTAAGLASLARLQKEYPGSAWAKEGRALEMEVRGKTGQKPRPDQVDQEDDADLKLMAVSALAQSEPEEALPMLSKILATPTSPRKVRERALFVLAQIGNEQASSAIAAVARGNQSPELQRKAIQYLGVFGQPANRKVLSEIYSSTTDNSLRKQILNSFMVSGDRARVLQAARTEKDPELRASAIRLLGVMGGAAELGQMYPGAATAEEKKAILQALFVGGALEPLANAARTEKDRDVRLAAVRNLGLMGKRSDAVLIEMYRSETDMLVKKEVLNAFFLQGNSTRLVEIARSEKDPGLKKEAVHWLSLTNSKEARAFMIELLKE